MEPRRMIDGDADDFQKELLAAGKQDGLPSGRRELLLNGLGVAGVAAAGGAAQLTATQIAASNSATNVGLSSGASFPGGAGLHGLGVKSVLGKALVAGTAVGTLGVLAALRLAPTPFQEPEGDSSAVSPKFVVSSTPAVAPTNSDPVAPPTTPSAEDAPEEARSPVATRSRSEVKKPEPAPVVAAPRDSLTQELALVEGARNAVAQNDGKRALQQLDVYAQRFPKGSLRTEASVLRIEALSAQGNRAEASRLGMAFLKRSPNGPYARRIRSVLGKSDPRAVP